MAEYTFTYGEIRTCSDCPLFYDAYTCSLVNSHHDYEEYSLADDMGIRPSFCPLKIASDQPVKDSYKIRLLHEYFELVERMAKLEKMLMLNKVSALDFEFNCPVELLQRQFVAMASYSTCLLERLRIEIPDIEVALEPTHDGMR